MESPDIIPPFLPEDIIFGKILPRLPVKSLLRFRGVSKSWRSVIASKRFKKSHLKNSIKSPTFIHHWLFFDTIDGFNQWSLPSLFSEPFTEPVSCNADLGINFERDLFCLVGICNGVVCILVDERRFILWNPATRKSNYLPDFHTNLTWNAAITKYGFGFDDLDDDFKVFGILSLISESGEHFTISKVYSLRTNSWEVVEGRDASPFEEGGTYVNGKLHWVIPNSVVASFDMNSHVYGMVELPRYSKEEFKQRVGVLKGCLTAYCFHRETHIDVWLMKEYGVKESWLKVATIPYYHGPRDFAYATPFAIFPNGEVLVIYATSAILFYDPKGNMFRRPQITGDAEFLELGMYVESLASVVPDA
ncbi:hypothetical protein ACS0TY_004907 [Phlomoides rotata]